MKDLKFNLFFDENGNDLEKLVIDTIINILKNKQPVVMTK